MYLLESIVFFIKKIRSPFVILLSISWLVIFNIGDKKEKDEMREEKRTRHLELDGRTSHSSERNRPAG